MEALNVWVVDKADYPLKPTSPNKRKNVLLGLLAGLAGGIGLALGLEYLNHTVKTTKDVTNADRHPDVGNHPGLRGRSQAEGAPGGIREDPCPCSKGKGDGQEGRPVGRRKGEEGRFLGPPRVVRRNASKRKAGKNKIELIAARESQSIQAESYRSIRTTLLVSSPPGRIKTILFTSPLAREGKSSTVSNLGMTLAEASKRVVIVDSDLRKPKQARIFGIRERQRAGAEPLPELQHRAGRGRQSARRSPICT